MKFSIKEIMENLISSFRGVQSDILYKLKEAIILDKIFDEEHQ